jgi:homocysteine S-methyltransferase
MVGGCCGTGAAHIKAVINSIKAISASNISISVEPPPKISTAMDPVKTGEKSRLAGKIADGKFVFTVEVTSPIGPNPEKKLQTIEKLKNTKVDAVNIPDGPRASSKMSPLAFSILIKEKIGIEPLVHYCCRDRNVLGMQSDFLGMSALDLNNVLIITGDPPKLGKYPDVTAVFDIDSIGLVNLVSQLNHGLDMGKNPTKHVTKFFIGVGLNPMAMDMERELKRFVYKVEAGAEFAITQPIFDIKEFLQVNEKLEKSGKKIPLIAGIWPLASYRNAEFLNHEVPEVKIPGSIMKRMLSAQEKGKEYAIEEGLNIAAEIFSGIKPLTSGIQVSAPFGNVDYALKLIERI